MQETTIDVKCKYLDRMDVIARVLSLLEVQCNTKFGVDLEYEVAGLYTLFAGAFMTYVEDINFNLKNPQVTLNEYGKSLNKEHRVAFTCKLEGNAVVEVTTNVFEDQHGII